MRSDAYILVTCDICKCSEEIQLTATARGGYDERDVDAQLQNMGWDISDGMDVCAECIAEQS